VRVKNSIKYSIMVWFTWYNFKTKFLSGTSKFPLANTNYHHCCFGNEETVTQIIDMKIIKPYGCWGQNRFHHTSPIFFLWIWKEFCSLLLLWYFNFIIKKLKGRLAGSVKRGRSSWSWECEFKPHVGHRDYLKKKKKIKTMK